MIIIKKANAYSYYFGPLECECQKLHSSEEGIPYCSIIFKIHKDLLPEKQQTLRFVMRLFSEICLDKAYFIPHFYFQIKDIVLICSGKHESMFKDLDDAIVQKLNQQFFFTAKPMEWQEPLERMLPSECNCS